MALNTQTKAHLDAVLGHGSAAKMVTAINGQSNTVFDRDLRGKLERILGGIGEANAFIAAIVASGTISQAAINRLEHALHGRHAAEDLKTAISTTSA